MAEKAESSVAPAASTSKEAAKSKQPRAKAAHPPASEMVVAAITHLNEKGGSSLQAIKKFIAGEYVVDVERQGTFIRKYLKAAVANKTLIQTKGTGAAGSFKLNVAKAEGKARSSRVAAPKAKKSAVAEKKKPAKVAAKPPKAKSTAAKPKVAKASPKKSKTASPKPKKTAAKKAAKQ